MDSLILHIKQLIQSARLELDEASSMSSGVTAEAIDNADGYLLRALDVIGSDSEIEELNFG